MDLPKAAAKRKPTTESDSKPAKKAKTKPVEKKAAKNKQKPKQRRPAKKPAPKPRRNNTMIVDIEEIDYMGRCLDEIKKGMSIPEASEKYNIPETLLHGISKDKKEVRRIQQQRKTFGDLGDYEPLPYWFKAGW